MCLHHACEEKIRGSSYKETTTTHKDYECCRINYCVKTTTCGGGGGGRQCWTVC